MDGYSIGSEFVEAAIENLRHHNALRSPDPDIPAAMRDRNALGVDDWVPWQPIPSTVTNQDIHDLQIQYDGALPGPYVEFLKHLHFYELTECGVGFERHLVGRWKEQLIELHETYRQHFPEDSHLIPFGRESFMDAGPVCFDFKNRRPDGDCPIVVWDHEWMNTDQEIRPLFSSSERMFTALSFDAKSHIDFVYGDPDEHSEEEMLEKGRLLADFLAIDPEGAGGPARNYWTCWGVSPQTTE